MSEYISREAVFQVVHGIARGIADRDIEALKAKDMRAFYMAKGAKEILDSVDTDLCYVPTTDVQPVVDTENMAIVSDEFICKKCGIYLKDYIKVVMDEDNDGYIDEQHYEYEPKFCPECGAKVESRIKTPKRDKPLYTMDEICKMNGVEFKGGKENAMEDLIPFEMVLADIESDCGIVAEGAKDYLDIHRDEYRGEMNALYKSLRAINKKVIKREIPEERRADSESLRDLEKGIAARIAENEAMLNRSIVNATKEGTE